VISGIPARREPFADPLNAGLRPCHSATAPSTVSTVDEQAVAASEPQVIRVHPVKVSVRRAECGCVIWRFPFDDWVGFDPSDADLEPMMFWRMVTGNHQPRLATPPGRKRRSPFNSKIKIKGPSGRPDHPIVDATNGELMLAGKHRCHHGDVYEAKRWSNIGRHLRGIFESQDRASLSEVEVTV
jgi:hypothetical protein